MHTPQKPPEKLRELAELYEQRNALYGDNYVGFGYMMNALASFTRGAPILPPQPTLYDWARLGLLVQVASKLTRYMAQWGEGGHPDSLDDLSVYAQMLRELDATPNETLRMWPGDNLPREPEGGKE